MRSFLALLVCSCLAASAQQKIIGYSGKYSGGSLPAVKTGQGMTLYLDTSNAGKERIVIAPKHGEQTDIPAKSVIEVSYGQEVHRRIGTAIGLAVISLGVGALMALSKSKKHYIGLVWNAGEGRKGGMVMQADKNEYRGIIAGLEGLTGQAAIDTDSGRPGS